MHGHILFPHPHLFTAKIEELSEKVAQTNSRLIEVNKTFDASELKTFQEVGRKLFQRDL